MGTDAPATITVEEIDRLRQMRWSELEAEAWRVGVSKGKVQRAETRDELRLAILREKAGV